jgi:peroxiredoxin
MNTANTAAVPDMYTMERLLANVTTASGQRLVDLAQQSPVLLVFLRHAGCTFCREAVADIAKIRHEIECQGTRIVLVHMGDRSAMEQLTQKYGLNDLDRICDSEQLLYSAFGLRRGTFSQLFGLKVWWRGFVAGLLQGHGVGRPVADSRQMPGVFYVDQGLIARRFRHQSAADRPAYDEICRL